MAAGAQLGWLALVAAISCVPPGEIDHALRAAPAIATEAVLHRIEGHRDDDGAVVLVVLDGARWQDVFAGADPQLSAEAGVPATPAAELMPHLHALIAERGAAIGAPGRGAPMAASGPNFVSLPGYTEIFTGRSSTGCGDNDCAPTRLATVMDEVAERAGAVTGDAAVVASWERIERAASDDPSRLVLSTGRSRAVHAEALRDDDAGRALLERGAHADPFPGFGDFRPDRYTAPVALRYLESRRPRLLFLGLGEPDEYAHRGDYAGYLASLRASDAIVGDLMATLDRMGPRGRATTVFVTADHGRARDYRFHGREFPESARVWLVAAGRGVQARGLAQSSRPHRLADVAPTVRTLLDLPADGTPSAGRPLDELLAAAPPPDDDRGAVAFSPGTGP